MSTRVVARVARVEAQQRVLLAAADLDLAQQTGAVVGEGDRLEGAGARVLVPHLLAGAPADQAGAAVAAGEREELAVGGEGEAFGRVGDAAEAVQRAQALAGRGVEDHDVAAVVGDGEGAAVGREGAVVRPRILEVQRDDGVAGGRVDDLAEALADDGEAAAGRVEGEGVDLLAEDEGGRGRGGGRSRATGRCGVVEAWAAASL
jgi:hypothetical protein